MIRTFLTKKRMLSFKNILFRLNTFDFIQKYRSAERTLQSSNLKLLSELGTNGLTEDEKPVLITADLLRDITAINEFLFCMESEPFISPQKANNPKRVPFKKVA